MLRFCLTVTISLLAFGGRTGAVTDKGAVSSNCSLYNKTVDGFKGWPYKFVFNDFTRSLLRSGNVDAQIIITDKDSGKVAFNKTSGIFFLIPLFYVTPDLNQDSRYTVRTSIPGKCEFHDVTLLVTDRVESCETVSNPDNIKWGSAKYMQSALRKCESLGEVGHKVQLDRKTHNFTVQWLHNCNATLPNNTYLTLSRGNSFEQLNFQNFLGSDVGVYTCAVTYKGRTRYVRTYGICTEVQDAKSSGIVRCDKPEYQVPTIGSNLTINCSLGVGIGVVFEKLIATYWNKTRDSNFECVNTVAGSFHPGEGNNSHHSCMRSLKKPNPQCFRTPPTPEQLKGEESYVIATLRLVNIQTHDLGTYSVVYEAANGRKSFYNVTVKLDERTVAIARAVQLGIGLGIAFLAIFIILLVWIFRFYLFVFWKTYFGTYDLDDRQYGAFLSYHFSKDIDIFAQQQTRDTCEAVRKVLEGLGLVVFDEHKDGFDGFRAASSVGMMNKCHRVVIILSHEYVRDNWSVFQLQQGFKSMIESGSRMVFVLGPGMKEYVNQHAPKDDTYRMIKRAMELNTVTAWPGSTVCCRRKIELEMRLAMPKLRKREGWKRRTSSDSEFGMHPSGVERVLSNITATTEIGSDDVDV